MSKSLFFYADGTLGEEPYLTTTDGSDASRVADIAPGAFDATQDEFAAILGSKVLFPAENEGATNETGIELYSYDSVTGTTTIVKDIQFGNGDSDPEELMTSGDYVYFTADTSEFGQEIWRSDGTESGTIIVKDVNPGNFDGYNNNGLEPFKGKALFAADDGTSGFETLYLSEGDDLSTVRLIGESLDEDPLENPYVQPEGYVAEIGTGTFFFSAEDSGDRELWMTDGTEAGTVQVADINDSGDSDPENFVSYKGLIYFVADNGTDGRELYRSNGTEGGTTIVFDINDGAGDSDPENLKVIGTGPDAKLIFSAYTPSTGRELWVSDGTGTGTELVLDIDDGATDSLDFTDPDEHHYFARVGDDKFVFAADDGSATGNELWISDGTTGGTELLKDIDPDSGFDSDPEYFMETGDGRAYFSAEVFSTNTNGVTPTGRELWTTDGTESGTTLVKNIANGDDDSDPFAAVIVDVNSPPTSPTLSSSTVSESADDGDTVGTLASTDAENDTITFTITDDPEDKFAISGNNLVIDGNLDFESDTSHSVTVQASDGNGGTSTSTFTISVTDVNEAPSTPTLDGNTVAEDSDVATIVGALSSSDPDGDSVTYALTSDAGGRFGIDGDNIVVNDDLDFESNASHSVTVEATDGNGGTSSQTFTINVTDVNEAPEDLDLGSNSVSEDAEIGDVVGALSSTDPDGDTVTYSLTSSAGGRFAIDGSNIVVANNNLDFESNASHTVAVEASDGNGGTVSESFTINVLNVDESGVATEGPDIFTGTSDPDTYDGLSGDDIIKGKGGADELRGSAGADKVFGQGGDDLLYGGGGGDDVKGGGGADEMFGNSGGDDMKGGAGADEIYGGGGKDDLNGGRQDDIIDGGKGKDEMTGGGGDDVFVFNGATKKNGDLAKTGKDTITDFNISQDIIDLSDEGLSFGDLKIRANGGDAKIITDKGEWIQLNDVAKSDVTSDIFDFG